MKTWQEILIKMREIYDGDRDNYDADFVALYEEYQYYIEEQSAEQLTHSIK